MAPFSGCENDDQRDFIMKYKPETRPSTFQVRESETTRALGIRLRKRFLKPDGYVTSFWILGYRGSSDASRDRLRVVSRLVEDTVAGMFNSL